MSEQIRFNVLTVSDRSSAGLRDDLSGPAVVDAAGRLLGGVCIQTAIVPDDLHDIASQLRRWAADPEAADLIVTTGGTGLAPRDVTPEATLKVIERRHDGLLELARRRCFEITPMTYLSRGVAGMAGGTLIINLPGSPRAAVQMIEALADVLPHAIASLRGEVKDDHPLAKSKPKTPKDEHAV